MLDNGYRSDFTAESSERSQPAPGALLQPMSLQSHSPPFQCCVKEPQVNNEIN